MLKRLGAHGVGRVLKNVWARRVEKPDVVGIHGTLFYELDWKKGYYPTKTTEK